MTAAAESDSPIKSDETPRQRFLRLAPARTEAAIKRIHLLSNLAGPAYQYERQEAAQIIEAVFDAVHDMKRRFDKSKSTKAGFTFKRTKE